VVKQSGVFYRQTEEKNIEKLCQTFCSEVTSASREPNSMASPKGQCRGKFPEYTTSKKKKTEFFFTYLETFCSELFGLSSSKSIFENIFKPSKTHGFSRLERFLK
jgi:hypothetical protein